MQKRASKKFTTVFSFVFFYFPEVMGTLFTFLLLISPRVVPVPKYFTILFYECLLMALSAKPTLQ